MRHRHLRFLVVDDFATPRRIIGKLLREIGFIDADEATDGEMALELLLRTPYDCVLADVDMPRLDGFELVAAMRRHPPLKRIPALLLSRQPSKEQVVRASRAGANGYLVHPLTRAVLEDRVRAALGLPSSAAPLHAGFGPIAPGIGR